MCPKNRPSSNSRLSNLVQHFSRHTLGNKDVSGDMLIQTALSASGNKFLG